MGLVIYHWEGLNTSRFPIAVLLTTLICSHVLFGMFSTSIKKSNAPFACKQQTKITCPLQISIDHIIFSFTIILIDEVVEIFTSCTSK